MPCCVESGQSSRASAIPPSLTQHVVGPRRPAGLTCWRERLLGARVPWRRTGLRGALVPRRRERPRHRGLGGRSGTCREDQPGASAAQLIDLCYLFKEAGRRHADFSWPERTLSVMRSAKRRHSRDARAAPTAAGLCPGRALRNPAPVPRHAPAERRSQVDPPPRDVDCPAPGNLCLIKFT